MNVVQIRCRLGDYAERLEVTAARVSETTSLTDPLRLPEALTPALRRPRELHGPFRDLPSREVAHAATRDLCDLISEHGLCLEPVDPLTLGRGFRIFDFAGREEHHRAQDEHVALKAEREAFAEKHAGLLAGDEKKRRFATFNHGLRGRRHRGRPPSALTQEDT